MKILDTRNLNETLEELETQFQEWKNSLTAERIAQLKDLYGTEELSEEEFLWTWEDEEAGSDAEELKNLLDLREQFGREWKDGVELILERDFEEYARQLAEDIGAIDRNTSWPLNCIDWSRAADQLMEDYSSVDYNGETYYYRE